MFENAAWLQLPDRGLIKVSGLAAEKFLQGQLTCDVNVAKETFGCLGAHCNVKGRILFTFRLMYFEEIYWLSLPKSQVEMAMQSLKKYAVFSKVIIEEAYDQATIEQIKNYFPAQETEQVNKLSLIQNGIAEIYPETCGQFTPHEINYHQLNAVSFDKGCYIGQEIVARMHYLGKLKTALTLINLKCSTPPQRGEKMFYKTGELEELAGYLVDFAEKSRDEYAVLASLYVKAKDQPLYLATPACF